MGDFQFVAVKTGLIPVLGLLPATNTDDQQSAPTRFQFYSAIGAVSEKRLQKEATCTMKSLGNLRVIRNRE